MTLLSSFIVGRKLVDIDQIRCHEEVLVDRVDKLVEFITHMFPIVILPSIIVCHKTNTLIDGHHRYFALKRFGFEVAPVTYVDYDNEKIVPHIDNSITKSTIIKAAQDGVLLPSKSSFHHFIDNNGNFRPIILMAFISDMCNEIIY